MGHGSSRFEGQPVVLVLGVGYGGMAAAKNLEDRRFNVIAVDRKDYFLHNIASLRALCTETFEEKFMIPTSKLLKHGVIVHAEIHELSRDATSPCGISVRVGDKNIKPDYLVIATGSSYAFPAKVPFTSAVEAVIRVRESRECLRKAEAIVIVGGGPVGVELAGEIRHFFPTKKVTLVSSQPILCSGYELSDEVSQNLLTKLLQSGVEVILGDRVSLANGTGTEGGVAVPVMGDNTRYLEGKRVVVTDQGKRIDTDLIYFCTGSQTNNKSFQASLSDCIAPNGRLTVNEYLQVQGFERVFALGDCANIEPQMAYFAGQQAVTVADNIQKSHFRQRLFSHLKKKPVMMVSVGPNKGAGQVNVGASRKVIGDFLVTQLKSKDLYTSSYWSQLGAKLPNGRASLSTTTLAAEQKSEAVVKAKKMTLQDVMNLDEATAKLLAVGSDESVAVSQATAT